MYLHHVILRFAHLETMLQDSLWGHGWIVFPGIPVVACAVLLAYTIERMFEIMPASLRHLLVFTFLFMLSLGISIGAFATLSFRAVEVADHDKSSQMLAFLDGKCVTHGDSSFCRAKRYLKL